MFIYIFASLNGQLSHHRSLHNPSLLTQEPSLSYANFSLRLSMSLDYLCDSRDLSISISTTE